MPWQIFNFHQPKWNFPCCAQTEMRGLAGCKFLSSPCLLWPHPWLSDSGGMSLWKLIGCCCPQSGLYPYPRVISVLASKIHRAPSPSLTGLRAFLGTGLGICCVSVSALMLRGSLVKRAEFYSKPMIAIRDWAIRCLARSERITMFSSVFEGSQCDLGVYVGPQALESAAAAQQSAKNVGQWPGLQVQCSVQVTCAGAGRAERHLECPGQVE